MKSLFFLLTLIFCCSFEGFTQCKGACFVEALLPIEAAGFMNESFRMDQNLVEKRRMKVYVFSGLGADDRVFQFLDLKYELVYLPWLEPGIEESISAYAKRMAAEIDQNEPFGLIGISYGGLVAVEVSKLVRAKKVILISSACRRKELRLIYRFFGHVPIWKIVPDDFPSPPLSIAKYLFSPKTQLDLFDSVIQDIPPRFSRWASEKICKWDNDTVPDNLILITGSKDRLMPYKKQKNSFLIAGGTHWMIVDRAEEISKLINDCFKYP